MTIMIGEWVVYHPPKSVAFGHQSKVRDPRKAWPMVAEFLASCAQLEFGHLAELTCYQPNEWTEATVAVARIREARQLFELENGPTEQHPRWTVTESNLKEAIRFALDDDRFSKQQMGPSRLHFYYHFLWREFERLPYWPIENEKRDRRSLAGVTLGYKGLFIQPTFVFPAPWSSAFLKDFLAGIEPIVPFRLRDQYFKRALPSKSGGHSRFLKLPKDWRKPEAASSITAL